MRTEESNGSANRPYRVVEHPGASADIAEIATWVRRKADLATAEVWVGRLRRFLQTFGTMPGMHPVVAPPPPRAVHRTNFERKRYVYYEVFEADRIVRVLYVWHGGRDAGPDLLRQIDPLRVSP